MSLDAGEDERFKVGFTSNQEVFGDAGELVGGASHLGHFDGVAFAFGGTNQFEYNPRAGGGDAARSIRNDGSRKCSGVILNIRSGVKRFCIVG